MDRKIANAKSVYKEKVEGMFRSNNTKDAWSGLKLLCGYNTKRITPVPVNDTYINDMNSFFARFDTTDFSEELADLVSRIRDINDERVVISIEEVVRSLKRVSVSKATGPDNVPARLIKYCAEQLASIIQQLFQNSIDLGVVASTGYMKTI